MTPEPAETVVRPLVWRDHSYKDDFLMIGSHPYGEYKITREGDHEWSWVLRPFIAGQSNYQTLDNAILAAEYNHLSTAEGFLDLSALDTARAEVERLLALKDQMFERIDSLTADYERVGSQSASAQSQAATLRERVRVLTDGLLELQAAAALALESLPEDQHSGVVGEFLAAIHRHCAQSVSLGHGGNDDTLSPTVKEPK